MAAKDWQSAAAEYAANEMEHFAELSAIPRSEIERLLAVAFRAGALAGFDRAEEIRREVMGK